MISEHISDIEGLADNAFGRERVWAKDAKIKEQDYP